MKIGLSKFFRKIPKYFKNLTFGDSQAIENPNQARKNMLKFLNKLISGDTAKPLLVNQIANGSQIANPNFVKNELIKFGILSGMSWNYGKMRENLRGNI